MRQAGKEIQSTITEFGKKLEEHQDFADMMHGTQALSSLSRRHDEEIQKAVSDPDTAPEQLPGKLTALYHQHQLEIDTFGNAFGQSSKKLQLWAVENADRLRTRTQTRFEADTSNAAGIATAEVVKKTLNNVTSDTGGNATPFDLDNKLATVDNQIRALNLSPYMSLEAKARTQKELEAAKQSLVVRDTIRMIDKDPTRVDALTAQYGQYLSPEHKTALDDHARTVQKRLDAEKAGKIKDAIVNEFIGDGAPGQQSSAVLPPSGDLWGRVKGAEGGLDKSGNALTSPKGAIGVSQIMPDTAKEVADQLGMPYEQNRLYTDQAYNEKLGHQYLDNMLKRYGGNETLASAAYNAGPGRVDSWLLSIGDPRKGNMTDSEWASRIPIAETRNYTLGIISGAPTKRNIAANPPAFPSPVSPGEHAGAVAAGDSISAGLIRHGGIAGKENRNALLDWNNNNTAAGGSPPTMIRDNVKKLPDENFSGKPVILSSGASNSPGVKEDDVAAVKEQIQTLKDKGATSVTLLGVGNSPKLAGWNDKLAEIAKDAGVTFAGPLKNTGGDGVHPVNKQAYKELALTLPISGGSTPPAAAAQPTGAGADGTLPAPGPTAPAPAATPAKPSLRRFPSREEMIARIPKDATHEMRSIMERGIDEARTELLKRTEEERSALSVEITGGKEKLANGGEYPYDEDTIRHYFEPKAAAKILNDLSDATAVGKQIGVIRETPVNDVLSTMRQLDDSLKTTAPGDYKEHFLMVKAYNVAAEHHLRALGLWPAQKDGDQADPVNYLIGIDPNLRNKYLTANSGNDPAAYADYAKAAIDTQNRLGVPLERQRLMSNVDAKAMAHKIIADPAQANAVMESLKATWGPEGYNHIFSDLVTHGDLPAAYQMMDMLDAPKDKWLLARGLTEQYNGKKSQENFWKDVVGEKQFNEIQKAIREDPTMTKVMTSFLNSNAGHSQVKAMVESLDTLAFSKKAFETSGNPAGEAIKAAFGNYSFVGTARVPNKVYDSVSQNAAELRLSLAMDNITIPNGYGGNGQPSREVYLAKARGNPSWITTAKEDGIMPIVDGQVVKDINGTPLVVKFGKPAPSAPALMPIDYTGGVAQ